MTADVLEKLRCGECGAIRVNAAIGSVCPNGHGRIYKKIPLDLLRIAGLPSASRLCGVRCTRLGPYKSTRIWVVDGLCGLYRESKFHVPSAIHAGDFISRRDVCLDRWEAAAAALLLGRGAAAGRPQRIAGVTVVVRGPAGLDRRVWVNPGDPVLYRSKNFVPLEEATRQLSEALGRDGGK